MSTIVKSTGGGDFEITPAGTYIGRCIKVIDLGTQTTTGQFGTKSQRKVMVTWELLDDKVKMADGRPYAVTQFYTASLHEKSKLRADLEAWRGRRFDDKELEGFDLKDVLGKYCMLQIVHSADGQYANVNAIMSYKGDQPEGVNELVIFDIDNPDEEILSTMSEKMQAKIKSSPEYSGSDWPSGGSEGEDPKDVASETPGRTTTTTSGSSGYDKAKEQRNKLDAEKDDDAEVASLVASGLEAEMADAPDFLQPVK